ncbi:MAG: XdhC family protein, partial [Verrucomicrobiota bacterium]|nr:XdhC family protein [Verrucomicrobiota bacterium]
MKEIHDIVREYQRRPNESLALATLVHAQGSSYRRPGARMLIGRDGATVGSLSGGCLEEEVAACGRDIIRTGRASLMSFDTRRRFGCNGSIDIFVEKASPQFLEKLAENFQARQTCTVATIFSGHEDELGTRLVREIEDDSDRIFFQDISPCIQLLVFGEGPDSEPLSSLGDLLGWSVLHFTQPSELPSELDEWTAAVVKTHNYGRDFAALQALLPRGLKYVGLVGPRRRRDQLLGDLLDIGTPIESQLYAPVGFDLAAETPEEIALAIVSEIQAIFAGGTGESLRDSKRPIHSIES